MESSGGVDGVPRPDGGEPSSVVPEAVAWEALRAACMRSGLDSAGAELLRSGTPTVFGLVDPVMARVSAIAGLSVARRTVAVARWLAEVGYPAVRLVQGFGQPILVEDCVVTFWRRVGYEQRWAGLGQIGGLARQLHWLEEPVSLGLECLDPLKETRHRIRTNEALSEDDRAFLSRRAQVLGKRFDELDFVLPGGIVHGDLNVGSVLLDDAGHAVLTDLDSFAVGPREWDLVLTALYYERLGWHTRSEYEAFVHGYGFDVMNWYGYATLADLRELMMTVWLAQRLTSDVDAAAEVGRRIQDLRSGGDRHGWQAF